jgi:hypothetical protein
LLKRVFDIDIVHCPHCGAALESSPPFWKKLPSPKFLIISAVLSNAAQSTWAGI